MKNPSRYAEHPLKQAASLWLQIATRRSVSAQRILPASGVGSSRHDPFLDLVSTAEQSHQSNAIPGGTPLCRDEARVPGRPPHGHHRCQSPGQKHLLLHQFRSQTTAHPTTTTGVAGAREKRNQNTLTIRGLGKEMAHP